jgi:hypothetical protein
MATEAVVFLVARYALTSSASCCAAGAVVLVVLELVVVVELVDVDVVTADRVTSESAAALFDIIAPATAKIAKGMTSRIFRTYRASNSNLKAISEKP